MKMVPEIRLLADNFAGKQWTRNSLLQEEFMLLLVKQDFFAESNKSPKDPALSARDRITRAPKALGFIDLEPKIELTQAGQAFVSGEFPDEALLRQLVKFQLPSPYHKLSTSSTQSFWVRPYLEILRLIRHFGLLTFDEVKLFGMQLTDYRDFDKIVKKIEQFRIRKAQYKGHYRKLIAETTEQELHEIYSREIESDSISIRENSTKSLEKFIKTKASNLRDYTDACFRYLRATKIVSISQSGHSLSIPADKNADVDYLLDNVPRDPVFTDDTQAFKAQLFDAALPRLLSDDKDSLKAKILAMEPESKLAGLGAAELKIRERELREAKKQELLNKQILEIKDYKQYQEIQEAFDKIVSSEFYDNPLMFEWNTWRAMTMLDGGNITGNFNFDDEGNPLSTASGNMPDIYCDYGDFNLIVEVTLQSGQKQYDNEGEPVARHLGTVKNNAGKETYCLFISPRISPATISYFFSLHHVNIQGYGGKAVIVPMTLSTYRKMLEDSYKASYIPNPAQVRRLFEFSVKTAKDSKDEVDWYEKITNYAVKWATA